MDLLSSFKKDYLNYLISIIVPAIIAGISVPLFKALLGAKGYGKFSIYYNASLIGTAVTTGWITQSIYRFYPSVNNKILFAKIAISTSGKTQLLLFLPVIFFIGYFEHDYFLGVLICLTIFTNSMQLSYVAIVQSSFLSKKIIYSESIRTVSYMIIAVLLLLFLPSEYLYVLLISIIISYIVSVFYLHAKTQQFLTGTKGPTNEFITTHKLVKQFFHYGAPLSMWIVFSYLLSYVDKLLMLRHFGPQVQGNYQAIFDLLSRGLTVLISPVIISLYPLLSHAYEKSARTEIKLLMKKIILFETAGLIFSWILYWSFGARLLFIILKVPDTASFRSMGFIIIMGTFAWQMAMVMHQQYVLKLKSLYLLGVIIIAFFCQLFFYWLKRDSLDPVVYPLGYLISACVYLFFVSVFQLLVIMNKLLLPIKKYFVKVHQ